MTVMRVELAPSAILQATTVEAWWRENRPAASELFMDELTAALSLLGLGPRIGRPYAESAVVGMRRLLMPRTRHHVYYTVNEREGLVLVHAVWHVSRGTAPTLA